MVIIDRTSNQPYQVQYRTIPLEKVANQTKAFPERYRVPGEMMANDSFKEYALPLIQGEAPNLWMEGLPLHAKLSLSFDE
jgi:6-phosphofructokinase 1